MSVLKIFLEIGLFAQLCLSVVNGGCYERRLCCTGRNLTCVAEEDGRIPSIREPSRPEENEVPNPVPRPHVHESREKTVGEEKEFVPSWHIHATDLDPDLPQLKNFFETLHSSQNRFAQLSLPKKKKVGDDIRIMNESPESKEPDYEYSNIDLGSGETTGTTSLDSDETPSSTPLAPNGGFEIPQVFVNVKNTTILFKDPTSALKYKTYFGKVYQGQPLEEQVVYQGEDPLIRYTILTDIVPYTVEQKIGFLKLKNLCYCDEVCNTLGDCCTDYRSVCPAQNCEVSQWTVWGPCEDEKAQSDETFPDETRQHCGKGVQRRERQILRQPEHGGNLCPHLEENRVCYANCENTQSEVALLLQYKHGQARIPGYRNEIYYDTRKAIARLESMHSYCVIFEAGWLNPNCRERDLREDLRSGSRVCLECQPTAQMAKGDRCTGEGVERNMTFWSMVGKRQCNGMWTRQDVRTPCSCTDAFLTTPAYIFV